MKLIQKLLLLVGVMILSSMLLVACSSSTKKDKDSDITGTYYLYEEDQLDKDSYFIITSSSWTDENNDSGTYKLNGTTIIFYMSESGNEELYRGTIGDGKLEITFEGIKTTYYIEGSEPSSGVEEDVFYTITFKDYDGTVLQTSSVKKGETPAYNKSNPSRENDDNYSYTFSGWQPALTKVSEDAIYTATYTSQALPYYVIIDLDGGTSSATKLQFKTDKISRDMLPLDVKKNGYVFKGYSLNDVKVYDENGNAVSNYQPSASMTFEAIYIANKYTITIDNQAEGVTISGITSGNEYDYDSEITLTATNIPSGCTIQWTRSGDVVKVGDTYTFNVPADNITITTTTLSYTREENKIYFGTYPQTKVTATTENGLLSITFDSSTWTSYRYYMSWEQSDFMYYKDVDIDNNGTYDYRGVYFTQYRPNYSTAGSSTDNTFQDENGYLENTIYWFSYDPIEWNILTESDGKALIIANLSLDSQDYYPSSSDESFSHNGGDGYINNYELSAIRKFLNDDFYNTAFNELQKAIIQTTTVDNSAASTGQSSNSYACNNTNDKMFLLSYEEVTTYYTSKTARQTGGSDYAKCQGLYNSSSGNGSWWLRSPSSSNAFSAWRINSDGSIYDNIVYNSNYGVRPVCWIML